MKIPFAVLCLACVVAPARSQDEGLQKFEQVWDDGSPRAVGTFKRGANGEELYHGAFKSFHPDGEVEMEGEYADGKRTGYWISRRPDGFPLAEGRYEDDMREGVWTLYYERGRPSARGFFQKSHRTGAWTSWKENGEVDLERTGFYYFHALYDQDTGRWWQGESFNQDKQGRWIWHRETGVPILLGDYRRGVPTGPWALYAADGSLEEDWITGVYELGVRIGPLTESPAGAPVPWKKPDLKRVNPPELSAEMRALIDVFAGDASPASDRDQCRESLLADPRQAFPAVLARLVRTNLGTDKGNARAKLLCELLAEICGASLPWQDAIEPDAVVANERTVLRWYCLWELLRGEARVWDRDFRPEWRWARLDREFTVLANPAPPAEFHRRMPGRTADETLAIGMDSRFGPRFKGRRRVMKKMAGEGTEEPLAQALSWIAKRQSASGAWDCSAYEGDGIFVVGVTAQCLLALLGDGNTLDLGWHHETVTRGLRWLVRAQDPRTGRIAEEHEESTFEHALALEALAEGACLSKLPALQQATARATGFMLANQRKGGSWARAPGSEAGDPATTSRAVLGLLAAVEAGILVDPEKIQAALAWLDSRTQINSGVTLGALPTALAPSSEESSTALFALARVLAGQTPERYRVLAQQAAWLREHVPPSEAKLPDLDAQFLCFGSHFACQLGGEPWALWNGAMRELALRSQYQDGDMAGSWDPQGPSGAGGGRLYMTATMALTLETYYRYALAMEGR